MSQKLLEEAERGNLFVVPLDEHRLWYHYHDLFREALLSALHTTHPELVSVLHRRVARFYEAEGNFHEAIAHRLSAEDFSAAAHLMEQTVESFWLRGEALPEMLLRQYARLALTSALYLLSTVGRTSQGQRVKAHQQVRQLIARIESALLRERAETSHLTATTGPDARTVSPPDEAQLQRRLRLLGVGMDFYEALAAKEHKRLSALHQQMQELDQDEEVIWQIPPLFCSFILHFTIRQEGARLLPGLLEARRRIGQSGSHFAAIKVRQWLVRAAVEAGQLRLAYQESQTALELIEQMAGYVLLKGYFEQAQIEVYYQWNRLEEARDLLHTLVQDAVAWHQLDLLTWGYAMLMQIALVSGDRSAAQQALHKVQQLVRHEGFGFSPDCLPTLRARWWLAQGKIREASTWAAGVIFPEPLWKGHLYGAFPVVIRVYFAELRFPEAVELLDSFRSHLDRQANRRIAITYLAQSLVALYQADKPEQARVIAERLFALTEPEGSLRVYLDEGEPMREALLALLTPHSKPHKMAASTMAYISKLLAAFEQEEQARVPLVDQPEIPSEVGATDVRKDGGSSLSRQELRVLRLLVEGQTYAEMAEVLIVSPNTIKTQVSSIYRKLGVSRRAEAITKTAQLHLLSQQERS